MSVEGGSLESGFWSFLVFPLLYRADLKKIFLRSPSGSRPLIRVSLCRGRETEESLSGGGFATAEPVLASTAASLRLELPAGVTSRCCRPFLAGEGGKIVKRTWTSSSLSSSIAICGGGSFEHSDDDDDDDDDVVVVVVVVKG